MFPYPIAKPQKCDIQTFYGPRASATSVQTYTWNKPVGVSHVYMMCIGGGGTGDGTQGGGSGAVTVWYGAAQHVPDSLVIQPSRAAQTSLVSYRGAGSTYTLLSAAGGGTPTAASASSANAFAASGFFNSVGGQAGGNGSDPGPSSTTFLGGGQRAQYVITGNYGYGINDTSPSGVAQGFFQLQPIIVGVGSGPNAATGAGLPGAIGCGGGGNSGGTQFPGGPGMVLIASW
jgi:hypothetical protein